LGPGFWKVRYLELLQSVYWALIDVLVIISVVAFPLIAGVPQPLTFVFGSVAAVFSPILSAERILKGWKEDVEKISIERPSLFLGKLRDIRRGGLFVEFSLLVVIVFLLSIGGPNGPLSSSGSISIASFYLFLMELGLIQTRISVWKPKAEILLRACLRSELEDEPNKRGFWLDDAIGYFNSVGPKKIGLGITPEFSLRACLIGSPNGRLVISRLLWDVGTENYSAFVKDLAAARMRSIPDIVGEVTLMRELRNNMPLIISLFGVAVTIGIAYGVVIFNSLVMPMVQSWVHLIQLFH
jgi:hypothetical protein